MFVKIKISAVTHEGVNELIEYIGKKLKTIPKEELVEIDDTYDMYDENLDQQWYVERKAEDYFLVYGVPIERLMSKVNVFDVESRLYMQRVLKNMGVMDKLKELGLREGDTIDIIGYQMEYSD